MDIEKKITTIEMYLFLLKFNFLRAIMINTTQKIHIKEEIQAEVRVIFKKNNSEKILTILHSSKLIFEYY